MALALPPSSSPFPFFPSKSFKPPNATSHQISNNTGVIIVGAGLAGFAAATRLQAENTPFVLLEASDAVGGCVRTDFVDGYTLDRGFQIFITAYPEARKLLDYGALDLQTFYSGAQVFYDGRFHTVADPLRHLPDALRSLVDKLLIGLTRIRVFGFSVGSSSTGTWKRRRACSISCLSDLLSGRIHSPGMAFPQFPNSWPVN